MLTHAAISLLWATFFALVLGLMGWRARAHLRVAERISRHDWAILLGLGSIFAVALIVTPVWGLEYEDAYEYEYGARFLAHHGAAFEPAGLNPICIDGSLEDCRATASLSHPTGVAVLASWWVPVVEQFGVGAVRVSSLAMFAIALVTMVALLGSADGTGATYSGVGLLIAWPNSAYFGSGFAEPFSATLTVVALASAWRAWSAPAETSPAARGAGRLALVLLATAVALAVLCKREAIAVPLVLVPAGLVRWFVRNRAADRAGLHVAGAALVGAAVATAVGSGSTFSLEAIAPADRWPFALTNTIRFLPDLLALLVGSPAGNIAVILCAAASAAAKPRALVAIATGIAGVYVVAFTAFDQDYDTAAGGASPLHHFERYTLQIVPLLSVVAGLGGATVLRSLRSRWPAVARPRVGVALVVLVAALVAALSARSATLERSRRRHEEETLRIEPMRRTCAALPENTALVTEEPIVAGIVCPATQEVIDLASLHRLDRADLDDRVARGQVFFLQRDAFAPMLAARYPDARSVLQAFERVVVASYGHGVRMVQLRTLEDPR